MNRFLTSALLLAAACSAGAQDNSAKADSLVIDKGAMTLTVYHGGRPTASYGVATGLNPGDKRRPGDMRTPEGRFTVSQIVDASSWTHDFGDGLGEIKGAYGPWFMRLATPGHKGIGIHGTHAPASIGTRASEGCIRLANTDCEAVRRVVRKGTPVIIHPGEADLAANAEAL